jgi:ribokinase
VVITAGGDGAVCADAERAVHIPAPQVVVVDSTGAGDAFAGALAAALGRGAELAAAAQDAVAAGAAAVQWRGAQPALREGADGGRSCE